jgi:hypothetical protein
LVYRRRIQKKSRHLLTDLSSQLPAHDPEFLKEFCEVILLSGKLGAHGTEVPKTGSDHFERDDGNQTNEGTVILELREDVLKSHTRRSMNNRDFGGIQLSQLVQSSTNRYEDYSKNDDSEIKFSRAVTASSIVVESDMDSPKINKLSDGTELEKNAVASEGSSKSRRRATSFDAGVVEGLISTAHKSLKRASMMRSTSFDLNNLTRRRSASIESNTSNSTKLLEHVRMVVNILFTSQYSILTP